MWTRRRNSLATWRVFVIYYNPFAFPTAGHPFEDTEFSHLGRIIEYLLAGAEAQIGSNAVEYIPIMGCLFDLIAWGKYKCSRKRLAKMRAKLDYLAGETQQIFVNYYNDFIEPHCK